MALVILMALIAQFGYAGNDLAGAIGSRKSDPYTMSILGWVVEFGLTSVVAVFLFRHNLVLIPVLVTALSGVLLGAAYPLFLTTLHKGNATINGVIANIFPLWVILFSLLFFHEHLTGPQLAAIAVIMLGVMLSAMHLTRKTRFNNIFNRYCVMAFAVSIMWGIAQAIIRYPIEKLGWFEAGYLQLFFGTLLSVIWLYPKTKNSLPIKFKKIFIYALLNSIAGMAAAFSYAYALTKGSNSIVAPIAGSSSALYAVMSYLVFREKLTKLQVTGVLLTLAGVIGLSIIISRL